jgi:hypothetical protein
MRSHDSSTPLSNIGQQRELTSACDVQLFLNASRIWIIDSVLHRFLMITPMLGLLFRPASTQLKAISMHLLTCIEYTFIDIPCSLFIQSVCTYNLKQHVSIDINIFLYRKNEPKGGKPTYTRETLIGPPGVFRIVANASCYIVKNSWSNILNYYSMNIAKNTITLLKY